MRLLCAGLGTAFALLVLPGCDRGSTPAPSASPGAGPTTSASPASAVVPQPVDKPTNPSAGPHEGSTAIGGMTGRQESGGQRSGAPAPTGGDGSTAGGTPAPTVPAASAAK